MPAGYAAAVRRLLVFSLALAVFHGCSDRNASPPSEEFAAQVRSARPDWANYGEDIKAELGATPVARWSGKPTRARLDGSRLTLAFELDAPWRDYDFGIPVLVRDPLGRVHRHASYTAGQYVFELEGYAPGAIIPWAEIRYPPNEEGRIAFDSAGEWRASGSN